MTEKYLPYSAEDLEAIQCNQNRRTRASSSLTPDVFVMRFLATIRERDARIAALEAVSKAWAERYERPDSPETADRLFHAIAKLDAKKDGT